MIGCPGEIWSGVTNTEHSGGQNNKSCGPWYLKWQRIQVYSNQGFLWWQCLGSNSIPTSFSMKREAIEWDQRNLRKAQGIEEDTKSLKGKGNRFSLGLLTQSCVFIPWCFGTMKPILDLYSPGIWDNDWSHQLVVTYHINNRNPVQAPSKDHMTEVKTENRLTMQVWPHRLTHITVKSNIGCNSLMFIKMS